jgi:ornithine carbamoyltransferase
MRHILSVADMSAEDIAGILDDAACIKKNSEAARLPRAFAAALLFERPSLRTRTSYEVAMMHLGGQAITFEKASPLGEKERLSDVAQTLSHLVSVIVARVRDHGILEMLAQSAGIPVINALSNHEHPIEVLADALTLRERWGATQDRRLAFIGDGSNVCHSLMLLCPLIGMDVAVASPEGYTPAPDIVKKTQELAGKHGTKVALFSEPQQGIAHADAVYTDSWPAPQYGENADEFWQIFLPYQINQTLLASAKPDAIVLHCLPAKRDAEITAMVLDGPQSLAFSRLSNLVPVTAAVLRWVLE